MSAAYIALGSNLGDRVQHLQSARAALPVSRASAIYETDPVDCPPGSQAFLNCILEIEWEGSAQELHVITKGIEASQGRPDQRQRNAPRPIDVDLLSFGDEVIATPELIIPHPRLHLRRFVLQPFSELSPDLILPGFDRTLARLLAELVSSEPPLRRHPVQWNLP